MATTAMVIYNFSNAKEVAVAALARDIA